MKQLFNAIQNSVYNPQFYRELESKPLRYSLKYYSAFAVLVAIILTIVSSVPLVVNISTAVSGFPQKFFEYYPDDLEVTVTNGVLSTNVDEPYVLPVPSEFTDIARENDISEFVVFDTKEPFSIEQFNASHALVWVGARQFAYRDKNSAVRIQGFEPNSNVTINETKLRKAESYISPYYHFVGPVLVVLIFMGLLFALGFNFLYLFLGALFIHLLLRVMKQKMSYGRCYQIGLHALTLPVLIHVLLAVSPFAFSGLPLTATIVMLVVVYFNFREMQHATPQTVMSSDGEASE